MAVRLYSSLRPIDTTKRVGVGSTVHVPDADPRSETPSDQGKHVQICSRMRIHYAKTLVRGVSTESVVW
jgi:hypothetical protein